MKRFLSGLLGALAATWLLCNTIASAGDISFASHSEIMATLERQNQRIAELEAASAYGGAMGGGTCNDGCCESGCDPCCRPGGMIGGAEISFLKFHESQGTTGGDLTDLDTDFDPAYRVWAGYQGSDGLGWRVRYWEFDHHYTTASIVAGNTDALDVDTYIFDVEFIDSMNLGCYWDASWYAGFRYVELDHIRSSFGVTSGALDEYSEFDNAAWGLTLGGELRRSIGCGLAGFVNARGSVLYGDQTEYDELGLVDDELNNIYYMWEAQAGVQWTRELQLGGYLFARAAAEVQYWDNFIGEAFFDGGDSVGFGGFSLSMGIIR
jgi:hypothetical protein